MVKHKGTECDPNIALYKSAIQQPRHVKWVSKIEISFLSTSNVFENTEMAIFFIRTAPCTKGRYIVSKSYFKKCYLQTVLSLYFNN